MKLESLDPATQRYYKQAGPLELAGHMLPLPDYPHWRIHMQLFPIFNADGDSELFGYQLDIKRLNLDKPSSVVKRSDHFILPFLTIPGFSADLMAHEVFRETLKQIPQETCALQSNCSQAWQDSGQWSQARVVQLEQAPWSKEQAILPALLRELTRQAGWLRGRGSHAIWQPPTITESDNRGRPWVEVTVDNRQGQNIWIAEWAELIIDPAIRHKLIRLRVSPNSNQAQVFMAQLCHQDTPNPQPKPACS